MRRALDTLSALVSAPGGLAATASPVLSQRPRMLTISFGDSAASCIGTAARGAGRRRRLSAAAT